MDLNMTLKKMAPSHQLDQSLRICKGIRWSRTGIPASNPSNPKAHIKAGEKDEVKLGARHLSFLDLDSMYFDLERFKREKSWHNLTIGKQGIADILSDSSWYRLYFPETSLSPQNYNDVIILQQIATELLRRFTGEMHNYCKKSL